MRFLKRRPPQNVLRVELGDDETYKCDCCDSNSRSVEGWILDQDDTTVAAYVARWGETGPHDDMLISLSIGPWDKEPLSDHIHVAWTAQRVDGVVTFSLVDEHDLITPERAEQWGELVPADKARQSEWINEVWHLSDHISLEDHRIATALEAL